MLPKISRQMWFLTWVVQLYARRSNMARRAAKFFFFKVLLAVAPCWSDGQRCQKFLTVAPTWRDGQKCFFFFFKSSSLFWKNKFSQASITFYRGFIDSFFHVKPFRETCVSCHSFIIVRLMHAIDRQMDSIIDLPHLVWPLLVDMSCRTSARRIQNLLGRSLQPLTAWDCSFIFLACFVSGTGVDSFCFISQWHFSHFNMEQRAREMHNSFAYKLFFRATPNSISISTTSVVSSFLWDFRFSLFPLIINGAPHLHFSCR